MKTNLLKFHDRRLLSQGVLPAPLERPHPFRAPEPSAPPGESPAEFFDDFAWMVDGQTPTRFRWGLNE